MLASSKNNTFLFLSFKISFLKSCPEKKRTNSPKKKVTEETKIDLESVLYTGYRILNTGYRILDTGYRILDAVYWMQDTGYQKFQECFTPGKVGVTGENIQPVLPGVSDKVGARKEKILLVLKVSGRISSKQSQIKENRFPVFSIWLQNPVSCFQYLVSLSCILYYVATILNTFLELLFCVTWAITKLYRY